MIFEGHSRRMLTVKQERFVQELIKGKSQRAAYRAAYNASKMKESTIDEKASRLFKEDKIRTRYDELIAEVNKQVVFEAAEVKQEILEFLMATLRADPYRFIKDEGYMPDTKAVKGYKLDAQGRVTYEFYDKLAASNKLCEMLGITMEEVKNDITIHIESEGGDQYGD